MAYTAAGPVLSEAAAPGNMGDVRRSNLALVLGRVVQSPPGSHLTRAQIAASTRLTKASVSSIVLDLLDAGILRERGLNPQGERGRPGVGLELNPARGVIGMEINVDYIAAGVTDLSGAVVVQEIRERDNRDSEDAPVLAALAALAAEVRTAATEKGVEVLGGGLAVPGLVDAGNSTVIAAPNLGWLDIKLDLDRLLPGLPLGVTLFNEAKAAALAELAHGPAGRHDFLYVSGEVGVGGGLVIGSELFTGPEGHAGEVGHIVVDPEGSRCSCGGTGCLETIAGQDAIFAAAGIAGKVRSESMSALLAALTGEQPEALRAVQRAGRSLGVAVASTARVVNIAAVVLGGHFAVLDQWLRPSLVESLATYAPGKILPEHITTAAVGEGGALLGAAGSVVRSLVEAPHRLQS
ncbi:putative NBD/HSP70 family sugar kinase [Pseudarthrobacter siccitolerans]|uniref:NBD/HSP70 family sugar kinase n=1 Tax=Pseudarthrobacter siccitolerans TaxID=861266 RepID=A0ABU0PGX1_9MICC|nr:ROK family protein [Pseudarthrobacter siccitolerans]MDQ0673209.1 putative NBD/HSP70 family sugar kinase [Pseudarthrobacter siccitolerans]